MNVEANSACNDADSTRVLLANHDLQYSTSCCMYWEDTIVRTEKPPPGRATIGEMPDLAGGKCDSRRSVDAPDEGR